MINPSSSKIPCSEQATEQVLLVKDIELQQLTDLLSKYQLDLKLIEAGTVIPGSYWGDSEAGLIASNVYIRSDTPVHSLLHESCHYICMDEQRRSQLNTDAAGDFDEENAVCYLQILLANNLDGMGSARMMQDMDRWGYTFRLGSARSWFENDADETKMWLLNYQLIDSDETPTFRLRGK